MIDWSNKKLKIWEIASNISLLIIVGIVPIIIINVYYSQDSISKITGVGLILSIVTGIVCLCFVRGMVSKMEQCLTKSILNLIFKLTFCTIIYFVIRVFNENFDLAYNVISKCLITWVIGFCIDYLWIDRIREHRSLRVEAQRNRDVGRAMKHTK